ncbi:putative tola protein [Toxoplasma gondii RUB]|uniref:Putative tola protein n=1 Tax=Toxoplasma gondii RUB TaxID=935652 RepID=A0A086M499_TOXGO|nr:putative tola protein [Toxoplasma gondii RUB]
MPVKKQANPGPPPLGAGAAVSKLSMMTPWDTDSSEERSTVRPQPAASRELPASSKDAGPKPKGPPPVPPPLPVPLPSKDALAPEPSPLAERAASRAMNAVIDPGLDDAPVESKKSSAIRKLVSGVARLGSKVSSQTSASMPVAGQPEKQSPSTKASPKDNMKNVSSSLSGSKLSAIDEGSAVSLGDVPVNAGEGSGAGPAARPPAKEPALASKASLKQTAPKTSQAPKAKKPPQPPPGPEVLTPGSGGSDAAKARILAAALAELGPVSAERSKASSRSVGSNSTGRTANAAEKAAMRSEMRSAPAKSSLFNFDKDEGEKMEKMLQLAEKAVAAKKSKEKGDSDEKRGKAERDWLKKLEKEKDKLARELSDARRSAEVERNEMRREIAARENSLNMESAARLREIQKRVSNIEAYYRSKLEAQVEEKRAANQARERLEREVASLREQHKRDIAETSRVREREAAKSEHKLQSMTETIQSLTTSVAQLQEISDVSRSALQAMEERNKLAAAKIEIMSKKEADREKEMRKLMPTREAKRLAFRALQKGRAVEMIFHIIAHANNAVLDKAWALAKMTEVLGGSSSSLVYGRGRDPVEDRLMQFRKEQMFLMTENERLMNEVSRLQEVVAKNKGISLAADAQEQSRLLEQIVGEPNRRVSATRWLFSVVQNVLQRRLFLGFTALKDVMAEDKRDDAVRSLQDRFNEMRVTAYQDMMRKMAMTRLLCIIKNLWTKAAFRFFLPLLTNAAVRRATQQDERQFLQNGPGGVFAVDGSSFRVASGELQRVPLFQGSKTAAGQFLPPPTYKDQSFLPTNAPVAIQPHYYGQLPSVQRKRAQNMFIPVRESPPLPTGYLGQADYMDGQMTVGVPLSDVKGSHAPPFPTPLGTRLDAVAKNIPPDPYSSEPAREKVDEVAGTFRMRTAQQGVQKRLWADQDTKGSPGRVGRAVSRLVS